MISREAIQLYNSKCCLVIALSQSLFSMLLMRYAFSESYKLMQLYPKKAVAEQLKQFTPGGSSAVSTDRKPKRITSAYRRTGMHHTSTTKSLLQQYENLDPLTKHAFNETFLVNLESVKHNMGKLFSQHVNREEGKAAINFIFPPQ